MGGWQLSLETLFNIMLTRLTAFKQIFYVVQEIGTKNRQLENVKRKHILFQNINI